MSYQSYVLGFIFDKKIENVLMIKRTPNHKRQANMFNGIGGKIEENETIYNAMNRESIEEIGFSPNNWEHIISLSGKGFSIYTFRAFDDLSKAKQMEEDEIYIVSLKNIPNECVEDVDWMLSFWKNLNNEYPIQIYKKGTTSLDVRT